MSAPVPAPRRPAPEHINRTTRSGADQYVLACATVRDAGDLTYANVRRIERDNKKLREEVAWKRQHASKHTKRWVVSKLALIAVVLAGFATLAGWTRSPNGRSGRVAFLIGNYENTNEPNAWREPHWLTRDMSQHDIDSLGASLNGDFARAAER